MFSFEGLNAHDGRGRRRRGRYRIVYVVTLNRQSSGNRPVFLTYNCDEKGWIGHESIILGWFVRPFAVIK